MRKLKRNLIANSTMSRECAKPQQCDDVFNFTVRCTSRSAIDLPTLCFFFAVSDSVGQVALAGDWLSPQQLTDIASFQSECYPKLTGRCVWERGTRFHATNISISHLAGPFASCVHIDQIFSGEQEKNKAPEHKLCCCECLHVSNEFVKEISDSTKRPPSASFLSTPRFLSLHFFFFFRFPSHTFFFIIERKKF